MRQLWLIAVAAGLIVLASYVGRTMAAASPAPLSTSLRTSDLVQQSVSASTSTFSSTEHRGEASRRSEFVHMCGQKLCQGTQPFVIHGATGYGTYDDPATEATLAKKANINTLAIVEFETKYHVLSDTMSASTWIRVDKYIATAKAAGLHVVLTLSSYAQSLQKAGKTPTKIDWKTYLSFIANRVNTVTGIRYKSEPSIALVQLWGEVCFPGQSDSTCPSGTTGTAQDMVDFYHRTMSEWHALAPNILVSTGGFSHLNGNASSGIPWRTIMSDPIDPFCELEVNSAHDVSDAVGKVTAYCRKLGKPWYLAAWSSCFADTGYPFWTPNDATMASHARNMFNLEHGQRPSVMVALGSELWNLRDKGVVAGHCDLGPAFPMTFAAIASNASSTG